LGATPPRTIPDDNLAYPVLIQFANTATGNGGEGSGFFYFSAGDTYLVTAAHVLFNRKVSPPQLVANVATLTAYSPPPDSDESVFSLDLSVLKAQGNVRVHPSQDVTIVKIGRGTPTVGREKQDMYLVAGVRAKFGAGGIVHASRDTARRFSDVLIGDAAITFGFPRTLALKEAQLNPYLPLLRSGMVAGVNPTNKLIVVDTPTYWGNSGGPVAEVEPVALGRTVHIIGVVSEMVALDETLVDKFLPKGSFHFSNSGYTVVASMDGVFELIDQPW
jgi:hypothetical protein